MKILSYDFEGPYTNAASLQDRSGVYVILYEANSKYYVLDAGESSQVKTRIENHDRADCWKRHAKGVISVAVYYTPGLQQYGRMEIEQAIRAEYDPKCGKQ